MSASVAARLLLSTSLYLAGSALWLSPAQAQFVCVGSTTGAVPVDGALASATGSPGNFACGPNPHAQGASSTNSAVGPDARADGNFSHNSANGPGAKAFGSGTSPTALAGNTATGFESNAHGD